MPAQRFPRMPPVAGPVQLMPIEVFLDVADGVLHEPEQDHVTLITLHGFKVFDKDGFLNAGAEIVGNLRAFPLRLVKQVLDQPLLFGVEGDHADARATRRRRHRRLQTSHHLGNDRLTRTYSRLSKLSKISVKSFHLEFGSVWQKRLSGLVAISATHVS